MRKMDPGGVRKSFSDDIDGMLAYMGRVSYALRGTQREKADISHLAESLFFDAYVTFEGFVFDLFLAYLNNDFAAYQSDLASRISASLKEKFGVWAETRVKFSSIQHLPVDTIADLLDPGSENLTFKNATDMMQKAQRWISAPQNNGIMTLSTADQNLIDTSRSMRNYTAHMSQRSYDEMNQFLSLISKDPTNSGLGRGQHKVSNIGSFLKARANGKKRVELYLRRLRDVSATM